MTKSLFIGGPLDGRYSEDFDGAQVIYTPEKSPHPWEKYLCEAGGVIKTAEYRRLDFNISGAMYRLYKVDYFKDTEVFEALLSAYAELRSLKD